MTGRIIEQLPKLPTPITDAARNLGQSLSPAAQRVGPTIQKAAALGKGALGAVGRPFLGAAAGLGRFAALNPATVPAALAMGAHDYAQYRGGQMDKEMQNPNSDISYLVREQQFGARNGLTPDDEGNWWNSQGNQVDIGAMMAGVDKYPTTTTNSIAPLSALTPFTAAKSNSYIPEMGMPITGADLSSVGQVDPATIAEIAKTEASPAAATPTSKPTVVSAGNSSGKKKSKNTGLTPADIRIDSSGKLSTGVNVNNMSDGGGLNWLNQLLPYLLAGGIGYKMLK